MQRRLPLVLTGAVVFLLLGIQVLNLHYQPILYLNLTHSEPQGIYRLEPFHGSLQVNELVVLDPPENARPYIYGRRWLREGWPLLKGVGALPGDRYCISDTAISINGRVVGPVSGKDSQGRPLPKLRGRFVVEKGYFLPLSTYIRNSFDGRYFGAVPVSCIRGKAIPVLTF